MRPKHLDLPFLNLPSNPNPSDYQSRIVAYLYGSTPVTRHELGEYLLARLGADKLATLVPTNVSSIASVGAAAL
jgi:hypothetical protein